MLRLRKLTGLWLSLLKTVSVSRRSFFNAQKAERAQPKKMDSRDFEAVKGLFLEEVDHGKGYKGCKVFPSLQTYQKEAQGGPRGLQSSKAGGGGKRTQGLKKKM